MRGLAAVFCSAVASFAACEAAAQTSKPPVKYSLMIVAGGASGDLGRRDGVAMGGAGIFMGREECEAAGAGVRFGVVSQPDGQAPPTIFWICVPMNKP